MKSKIKTSQRILLTALTLFNEHGENAVTSVDIALELDISPGNLYYHFKGKEVMIAALLELHQQQMMKLLTIKSDETLSAEDVFYFFYLLVEQFHLFRFFYRSPSDISEKYPQTQRARNLIMRALRSRLYSLLDSLSSRDELIATDNEKRLLCELLELIMMQSCQSEVSVSENGEEAQRYHVLSIMMVCILPRLRLTEHSVTTIQNAIQSHTLANIDTQKTPESLVIGGKHG